jgi:hypothetical protein
MYWVRDWIVYTGYRSGFYVLGMGLEFIYWVSVWILCTGYGTGLYDKNNFFIKFISDFLRFIL